jgi:hypothetical protein
LELFDLSGVLSGGYGASFAPASGNTHCDVSEGKQRITGALTSVHDGDTITVGGESRRLASVDAPELESGSTKPALRQMHRPAPPKKVCGPTPLWPLGCTATGWRPRCPLLAPMGRRLRMDGALFLHMLRLSRVLKNSTIGR